MNGAFVTSALTSIANHSRLRHMLARRVDDYIYQKIVDEDKRDLVSVRLRKYQFLSGLLARVRRNIERGYVSKQVMKRVIDAFVGNCLLPNPERTRAMEAFHRQRGEYPPTFIVLSPTQRCNLNCAGCYAASTSHTPATLKYGVVERVLNEVHDSFGSRFATISGGEPFLYGDGGRTLFDIFAKFSDMFFLVYTNGTLIEREIAEGLAELGNVTPAISVEGFEKETDARRGKGVFKKIMAACEHLRQAGVPFGISVTATAHNTDLLLGDEFYRFFFEEQGAVYMWQFQFMPIGRGKDSLALMVTPEQRLRLFRKWEQLLAEKKYPVADFWNSGTLSRGCIAYGRSGGYVYVDWNGNILPCVFVPYYVDNVHRLFEQGRPLADGLFSNFMKNGRRWQMEYGLSHPACPGNWLMPCSIRDHYGAFRDTVLTEEVRPEDDNAREALASPEYRDVLENYDKELDRLTSQVWEREYTQASLAM